MVKKRLDYIDAIGGIMILRMVYLHCCGFALTNSHGLIYSYLGCFLLWFFYKGGVMSKPQKMLQTISKGRDKLLIPFVAWSIVGLGLDVILYGLDKILQLGYYQDNEIIRSVGSLLLNGSVHGNMPIWFLLSYFLVKVLYAWVGEKYSTWITYSILCVALALPFILQQFSLRYPYYLCNVFVGFAAYCLASKLTVKSIVHGGLMKRSLLTALTVGVFVILPLVQPCSYDIRTNTLYAGSYPLWWIWGLAACVTISAAFQYIPGLTPVSKKVGLTWAGRKSMFILCYHWPVLSVLDFARKTLFGGLAHEWLLVYYGAGLIVLGFPIYGIISQSRMKKYLL